MVNLTHNAVTMLYNNQAPDGFEPWLQVIDIKKIKPASGNGADRYRIVLSDGASYISGMLATQLAPVSSLLFVYDCSHNANAKHCEFPFFLPVQLMESGKFEVNYVVQLKDYIGNEVQGRR